VASTRSSDSFDEDEEDDDSEVYDEGVEADSTDLETLPCPYCGAEVYEGADVCPKCGSFVTLDDLKAAGTNRSKWFVVAAILLIAIFAGAVGALRWLAY
jgi:hypothetical protein